MNNQFKKYEKVNFELILPLKSKYVKYLITDVL